MMFGFQMTRETIFKQASGSKVIELTFINLVVN